jgi:hypothetical protein
MPVRRELIWPLKLTIMKAILYVLLVPLALIVLFTQCEKEPRINIPDNSFLNALIEQGVDKNGDGNISPSEAEEIVSIYVFGYGISDLTGIEAFVNLDTLDCDNNRLTALNVSYNTGLKYLGCAQNQLTTLDVSINNLLEELDCTANHLTTLDVSYNTGLKYLACVGNQLTTLDVSNNSALIGLVCSSNPLTKLDVSKNTELIVLWCSRTQLTSLDISSNEAIHTLWINNMPTLYEVCVWTMPFPPEDVDINWVDSPNVYFTTECSK